MCIGDKYYLSEQEDLRIFMFLKWFSNVSQNAHYTEFVSFLLIEQYITCEHTCEHYLPKQVLNAITQRLPQIY